MNKIAYIETVDNSSNCYFNNGSVTNIKAPISSMEELIIINGFISFDNEICVNPNFVLRCIKHNEKYFLLIETSKNKVQTVHVDPLHIFNLEKQFLKWFETK